MLHPVLNDLDGDPYCGPTAISSITGIPISWVESSLGGNSKKRIVGVKVEKALDCLNKYGWWVKKRLDWFGRNKIMPLEFEYIYKDGPYLLITKNHYVAYSEGEFVDTSNSFPFTFDKWPGRFRPINRLIETTFRLELRR